MKSVEYSVYFLVSMFFCTTNIYGWGSPEGNVDHKPKINFYGSVKTHQGNICERAENITIERRYEQIQMFERPENVPSKMLNPKTAKEEIELQADPHKLVVSIDLKEVFTIQAVANIAYVYKAPASNSNYPARYIELIITLKDKSIRCLVPESTRLMFDEKSNSESLERTYNIESLALLKLEGSKEQEPKDVTKTTEVKK